MILSVLTYKQNITNLTFADDFMIFVGSNLKSIIAVKQILIEYNSFWVVI